MTYLEKLYRDIAPQVGLPVSEVERICRWQFLIVAEEMGSGNYTPVRCPFLGSFSPLEDRVEKKKEKDIEKNFRAFGYHAA